MSNAPVPAAAEGLPASKSTRCLTDHQKARFLDAVLEPLTSSELLDTGYNRDIRNARASAWERAYWTVRHLQAAFDVVVSENILAAWSCDKIWEDAERADRRIAACEAMREAQARLIRTPAPTEAALVVKRRMALKRCLPISPDDALAAVEADAAFLAAHPTMRQPRRRGPSAA